MGSLRSRSCSLAIWSLTALSISGFTSPARLSFRPATCRPPSATDTLAVMFGLIRHSGVKVGRVVTAT